MTEQHLIRINTTEVRIETPDGFGDLLTEAMAASYGYSATIVDDGGSEQLNPLTPAEFAGHQIVKYCREVVAAHRQRLAAAQAATDTSASNEALGAQIIVTVEAD